MTVSSVSVRFTGSASDLLGMFEQTAAAGDKTASTISGTFSDAAAKLSTAMSAASDKVKASLAEMSSGDLSVDQMRTRFEDLGATIDGTITDAMGVFTREVEEGTAKASTSVDLFRDKYASAMLQIDAANKAAAGGAAEADVSKGFDEATSGAGNLFTKLGNLTGSIPIVGEAFKKMGENLAEAESSGAKFSSVMQDIGKVTAVAGAAVAVGVAAESVHLAENFQKATAGIAATVGISQQAANQIGNAMLNTAGQSTFSAQQMVEAYGPVAAQLAIVQGHALSAAQATSVMKAASDLAEGSNTDLASSTSALASVMQVYRTKTSDAASVSDVLYNASRLTNTSIGSVAQQVDKLHGRLGDATPSLQQISGLMLSLSEQGVTGRQAMSGLSTAMTGLLAPSAAQKKQLDDLGVSTFDAQGKFVGMGSIIAQLKPKFADMSQAQQDLAAKTLFGAQSYQGMLQVINAGPAAFDAATASVSKTGAAHEAAEKQAATLHGTVEKLKATFEDLGTKLGNTLIPIVTRVGTVIAGVTNFFIQHKAAAIALAVVVGGVLTSALAVFVAGLFAADGALSFMTLNLGLLLAAVALLVVGIYELVTHWSQIWGEIKQIAGDAWNFIKGVFGDGVNFVKAHWKDMVEALLILVTGGIATIPVLIFRYWGQITQFTSQLWSDVTGFFTRIWTDVTKAVTSGIEGVLWFFGQLPQDVMSAVGGLLDDMVHFGENIVHAIVNGIGNVGGDIAGAIEGTLSHIPGAGLVKGLFGGADGGIVPGPVGAPLLMVAHGGEMIIPPAVLEGGYQPIPPLSSGGNSSASGSKQPAQQTNVINLYNVPTDPAQLSNQVAFKIRTLVK